MNSLIYDEEQVSKFLNLMKFGLLPSEPLKFYFQIHARKKHGSPVETILARKLIDINLVHNDLVYEVNKLTPFCGFMYIDDNKNG